MGQLHRFAEDFRDINRRVCVETFFIYQLTARPDLREESEHIVPAELLDQMIRCHATRRAQRVLSISEREALFTAFFLWEQVNIVGPSINAAFAAFDWPFIRALALRPMIRFSYFPHGSLRFRDFSNQDERVQKSLAAYHRAVAVGWAEVERTLSTYGIMLSMFSSDPTGFFSVQVNGLLPDETPLVAFA